MVSYSEATLNQPLLVRPSSTSTNPTVESSSAELKRSSVVLGIIFGIFIQFSTLGSNWLIIMIFGSYAIVSATKAQLIMFSLFWSIVTSAMSMWILKFLRYLVHAILDIEQRRLLPSTTDEINFSDRRMRADIMMLALESRFVGGALVGVSLAWTVTDLLLGLHVQMMYSIITLVIVSLWGCVLVTTFRVNECANSPNRASSTFEKLVTDSDETFEVMLV